MLREATQALSTEPDELPKSVWEIIEVHRYRAVRAISLAGITLSLGTGLASFLQNFNLGEFVTSAIPTFSVFLIALILNRHDHSARRSGPFLAVCSAVAMVAVRSFYAPEAAGHFLFFPAGALGGVLLMGFRAGLLVAFTTLAGLYIMYFVNLHYQALPTLVQADTPVEFVAAFVMPLIMIILAGRMLTDVQREYEASNRLLFEYLNRYRSLMSLLTNDLTSSISELREAERRDDTEAVKHSFSIIKNILVTAKKLRGESIPT